MTKSILRLSIASLLSFMILTEGKTQGSDITYETYCNSKFGYCVDYPSKILIPQGESGSGDGQVFASKGNENTLTIYRDFRDNMDPDAKFNVSTTYQEDIAPSSRTKKTVTYKKLGNSFYVVSGYQGKKIYYQKTLLLDNQLVTCILLYNEAEKDLYSGVLNRVLKSLK